ncbi:MAG: hypothetical protein Q9225_003620 [Loekoesia sp. 1 TL-2023]
MLIMQSQSIIMYTVLLALSLPFGNCLVPIAAPKFDNVHKFDFTSVNAAKVKSIIPQVGQEFALPVSEMTAGKNIKVQVPPVDILAASSGFDIRLTDVLNNSVPQALNDFGLDTHLATDGIPLLKDAVEGILRGDPNLLKRELEPRGGGLWNWIKGAGCAVFATAAVPGYLLAAADLAIANGDGQPLNSDLIYQMYPVHGDLATSGPVKVYYQAVRPPFFGNAAGITINRNIYIILPPPPSFTWQQYPQVYPQFLSLSKLLRHELQHVKQYHDSSYNLVTFAHKYLFQFCKAGGYSKNPLEQEATAQEYGLNTELSKYSVNVQFFLVWRTFGLIGPLGYPVEDHNHGLGTPIIEKRFERGVLQLRDREKDGTYCFRTFSAEEVYNRDATCVTPTVNLCNKMRKRAQDQRTHDKEGNPIGGDPDEREKCRHQKSCEQLKREWRGKWAGLSKRAWRCGNDVP